MEKLRASPFNGLARCLFRLCCALLGDRHRTRAVGTGGAGSGSGCLFGVGGCAGEACGGGGLLEDRGGAGGEGDLADLAQGLDGFVAHDAGGV